MIVKIKKAYRDTLLDMALVPCSVKDVEILVNVKEDRAKELIKAEVAEEYKIEKTTTKEKTEKTSTKQENK